MGVIKPSAGYSDLPPGAGGGGYSGGNGYTSPNVPAATLPRPFIPPARPLQLPGENNIVRFRPAATAISPPPPPNLPYSPKYPGVRSPAEYWGINPNLPPLNLLAASVANRFLEFFVPDPPPYYSPTDNFGQPFKPFQAKEFSIATYGIHVTMAGLNDSFDTHFNPPYRTPLIFQDSSEIIKENIPNPNCLKYGFETTVKDAYGNNTKSFFKCANTVLYDRFILPIKPKNTDGVAAPTAPSPERTPELPPTIPDSPGAPLPSIPQGDPEIVPFRRRQPDTPPDRSPSPNPPQEPTPEPAPTPDPQPEPAEPDLPPSDPEAPPQEPAPDPAPNPPSPTPTPNPTPAPDKAPSPQESPPVEPKPRVPAPAPIPASVPAPNFLPPLVPAPIPGPTPTPVPAPEPRPTPTPDTPTYPSPSKPSTPAQPQPAPEPEPKPVPDPGTPETPVDPQPQPQPDPVQPQPQPQPQPDPGEGDIQEWSPYNDPAVLPGATPFPGGGLPLTIPPAPAPVAPVAPLPIPSAPGYTPTPVSPLPIAPAAPNPVVPITPTSGPIANLPPSAIPVLPTTVVPQIPPAAKPIYQPNTGPGTITPTTPDPAPLDPCKSKDPCLANISNTVGATDLVTKATAAQNTAILALLTPVPTPVKVFLKCDKTTPEFSTEIVLIPGNAIAYVSKLFDRIAKIEAQQCTKSDDDESIAIATVPEWWQIPIENYRPQLIVIYRVLKDDGTWGGTQYAITIPNPNEDYKKRSPQKPSFPEYKKGNYQGILRLTDNTKLIVNCKDTNELDRLMPRLIGTIDRAKLTGKAHKTVIHPPGTFNEANVKPWRVDYYVNGRGEANSKGLKPTWSWKL